MAFVNVIVAKDKCFRSGKEAVAVLYLVENGDWVPREGWNLQVLTCSFPLSSINQAIITRLEESSGVSPMKTITIDFTFPNYHYF